MEIYRLVLIISIKKNRILQTTRKLLQFLEKEMLHKSKFNFLPRQVASAQPHFKR